MNLAHLMPDTATVAPFTGRDGDGKPTFGAQVAVKGREEKKQKQVINTRGEEVTSDTQFATQTSIGVQDRVWLPGADTAKDNEARTPVALVSAKTLQGGLTLLEVMF